MDLPSLLCAWHIHHGHAAWGCQPPGGGGGVRRAWVWWWWPWQAVARWQRAAFGRASDKTTSSIFCFKPSNHICAPPAPSPAIMNFTCLAFASYEPSDLSHHTRVRRGQRAVQKKTVKCKFSVGHASWRPQVKSCSEPRTHGARTSPEPPQLNDHNTSNFVKVRSNLDSKSNNE